MRHVRDPQLPLSTPVPHEHARELDAMSHILDAVADAERWVFDDLVRNVSNPRRGRNGMRADQVLRILVLKQLTGFSYDLLHFMLVACELYRLFCRFGHDEDIPKVSTLKTNLKKVRPETLEAINQCLVHFAADEGIERGRKVRTDCTVEETNIHQPSDSSLLWDCVRVLARLLGRTRELTGHPFTNHSRRAKRRTIAIQHARNKAARLPLYRDLLKVTHKTVGYAESALVALDHHQPADMADMATQVALTEQLRHYLELAHRVIDQTRRRVIESQSVPAAEKILSIFEPHTDIIIKSHRDVEYGHKLCLTTGASGLVLDCVVLDGNPADSTLAVDMIERQKRIYGRSPRQACFDGAFASRANLNIIKGKLEVQDVAFHRKRGLEVGDMVRSSWVYRTLKRFRAGIEANIAFLKRCFGLDRCNWRSLASFKAYTWASVVSHNLLLLARHRLA